MTNTDIVIPRSELPEVVVTNHGNAYSFRIKDEVQNPTSRQKALEYLALDEAIDGHVATLKQAKADAADEKKLDEEALALFNARHNRVGEWGISGECNKNNWRNVAPAARELHGK